MPTPTDLPTWFTLNARRTHEHLTRACGAHNSTAYWRTPTKIAGDKPLETLPRTSVLPSALIAPL